MTLEMLAAPEDVALFAGAGFFFVEGFVPSFCLTGSGLSAGLGVGSDEVMTVDLEESCGAVEPPEASASDTPWFPEAGIMELAMWIHFTLGAVSALASIELLIGLYAQPSTADGAELSLSVYMIYTASRHGVVETQF